MCDLVQIDTYAEEHEEHCGIDKLYDGKYDDTLQDSWFYGVGYQDDLQDDGHNELRSTVLFFDCMKGLRENFLFLNLTLFQLDIHSIT